MKSKHLFQKFFKYVTLNILGMLGLSCYILADTFFVSKGLGACGLTALNLAIPIYSFVHGSGLMLGMGGATKYSIFKGQKEYENANKIFTTIICLTIVFSLFLMLAGILFSETLTSLVRANEEVFDMTKTYLQVILLFSPAFMMNDILLCFVRNDGNPRLAMTAMLLGSLSNIIMDYIFIFPLNMGIFGAVLATGFAPVISMFIMSRHWFSKRSSLRLTKPKLCPRLTLNTLSLGIPSLITEVASGIVIIVFNYIILHLQGNIGVAAYGVVANLSLVITAIYTGMAQGIQPITSEAYGYGKNDDAKRILSYAVVTMFIISAFIYIVFLFSANPITRLFNSEHNEKLQQIAVNGLKLYFIAMPFAGFNIILSTYFTSTERAFPAQIISLLRGFFVVIPMTILLSFVWGMTGVWMSYPITEMIVCVLGIVLLGFYNKSTKQL